ncbi:hypothetical protein GCM10010271_18280 [Streptomyces kurssanovii]|nr:hypothetical protein GCM10010271_18280 [Streptomyces kurssanovii]
MFNLHAPELPGRADDPDLTWDRRVSSVISQDSSVRVLATGPSLKLRITPGTLGAVHRAVVRTV